MAYQRTAPFWLHLPAGQPVGVVILIMAVAGVALASGKQALERPDPRAWSAPFSAGTERRSPETLLANVLQARPEAAPTSPWFRGSSR